MTYFALKSNDKEINWLLVALKCIKESFKSYGVLALQKIGKLFRWYSKKMQSYKKVKTAFKITKVVYENQAETP